MLFNFKTNIFRLLYINIIIILKSFYTFINSSCFTVYTIKISNFFQLVDLTSNKNILISELIL